MAALVPFNPRFSELGRAVVALPDAARKKLRVPAAAFALWDVIVGVAASVTNDDDTGTWTDKFVSVVSELDGALVSEELIATLQEIVEYADAGDEPDKLPAWLRQIGRDDYHRFIRRSVGQARYEVLRGSMMADLAVVTPALRKVVEAAMPYALAVQDMAAVAGPLRRPAGEDLPAGGLLGLTVYVDRVLDYVTDGLLGGSFTFDMFSAVASPSADDVDQIVPIVRQLVSGRSRETAGRLNSMLRRKIQGAHDAVSASADPVSQAANSLVELIDRLLRDAYTEEEVLAWIDVNYPGERKRFTFEDSEQGLVRPNKQAQALMLVNVGEARVEDDRLHELAATVLVKSRRKLQALKHADTGKPEELEELGRLMAGVEAFLLVVPSLMWATRSVDSLEQLYSRLDPARVVHGDIA